MTNTTQTTSAPIAVPEADEPSSPPPAADLLGPPPPNGRIVITPVFDVEAPLSKEMQDAFMQTWQEGTDILESFGVEWRHGHFDGLPCDPSVPPYPTCSHCGAEVGEDAEYVAALRQDAHAAADCAAATAIAAMDGEL